jgi:SAM-dependent methyltransferase
LKKSEYARMAEYEQNYWWHIGRLEIIQTYVKKALKGQKKPYFLNIGCGTGGTIDMLEKHAKVENADISDEAITFMNKMGYKNITKVDDIELPYADKTFDAVGAFDVLEHIEDQVGALKEWHRVLKDDGAVIITVPAYQWLWSEHDVSLHHKRRYTIKSLIKAAEKAGFKPEKKSYAIVFSLPLVVGFRFVNKALRRKINSETSYVPVSDKVNKLFTKFLKAEAKLHKKVSLPAGTTVVTILRKK